MLTQTEFCILIVIIKVVEIEIITEIVKGFI